MFHEGFTFTVFKRCEDGTPRQVIGIDTDYLATLVQAHGTNDTWSLDLSPEQFVVVTHYRKRLNYLEWAKQWTQRKILNYQLKRALEARRKYDARQAMKRSVLGQSDTTISTQVVPTPEEFHAQLTSSQDSLKDKPSATQTITNDAAGRLDVDTTLNESAKDHAAKARGAIFPIIVRSGYFCQTCGAWNGEPHKPDCTIYY